MYLKQCKAALLIPIFFINDPRILVYGMLSALASAGIWLQIASYFGWPVSTTHSIVGAIVGFGAIVGGVDAVYWDNVGFILTSWILSPVLGGILGYYIFIVIRKKIFYAHNPVEATRRYMPVIVFIVASVLALILVLEGFRNLHLDLTNLQKIFSS